MKDTVSKIKSLVKTRKVRISEHAYDELAEDGLTVRELLNSMNEAEVVENDPYYPKGPCILLLHRTQHKEPIHAVSG